ncbi:hypothetical protein H6G80_33730 [Nostoc sp. FACHB-87]|nr:hypothetical protein [Nostoc sp. FACHB-190]MBD2458999.1 hypothetical protein [Nostoc sp. FACHB-87]MBD2480010.1 hypothetical protein [Anabaena sp. FACHB-83]MBD2492136.1 hypothetical protein [Aulosira sp. FACHB-615]
MEKELTRPQVASRMVPAVTARQLLEYINIARKYEPSFERFTHPKTGGINGYAKLREYHIPVLQEIRALAREHTLAEIEEEFKKRASKRESSQNSKLNNKS